MTIAIENLTVEETQRDAGTSRDFGRWLRRRKWLARTTPLPLLVAMYGRSMAISAAYRAALAEGLRGNRRNHSRYEEFWSLVNWKLPDGILAVVWGTNRQNLRARRRRLGHKPPAWRLPKDGNRSTFRNAIAQEQQRSEQFEGRRPALMAAIWGPRIEGHDMTTAGNAKFIEKADAENEIEIVETFEVNSGETANWVVRKICEARAYSQQCAAWCAREQVRAKRTEEFFLWRFGDQLRQWLEQQLAERGGRQRSVNLPGGTIGLRHAAAQIVVENESAVIAWAKSHRPELVVASEKLSKSGLNAYVAETGELPGSGVRVEPERDNFYIK